jgi:hypothetical protein
MHNNWMWSAVDQALLGLRGFPYHLELISGPFFFFSIFLLFLYWKFGGFFKILANLLNLH